MLEAIHRGRRRIAVGALIGFALGLGVLVLLLVAAGRSAQVLGPVLLVLAFTGAGGGLGGVAGALPVATRMRNLLGSDIVSSGRIVRAVIGGPDELTGDEAARAARYAVVAPQWLMLQLIGRVGTTLGVLALVAGTALQADASAWPFAVVGALLLVNTAATLPLRLARIRRMRAYAAAHPVEPTP